MRRFLIFSFLAGISFAVATSQLTVPIYSGGTAWARPDVWYRLCGDTPSAPSCVPSSSLLARDSGAGGFSGQFEGTNAGAPNYVYAPATGRVSVPYAAHFNGTDDFFATGSALYPQPVGFSGPPFTLCFWEYPDSVPGGAAVSFINAYNNIFSPNGWVFWQGPSALNFQSIRNGSGTPGSVGVLNASAWNFVCGVVAPFNASRTLYVDGVSSPADATPQSSIINESIMVGGYKVYGSQPSPSSPGNGTFSDVEFFYRELSPAEISSLFVAQAMEHAPKLFDIPAQLLADRRIELALLPTRRQG